MEKTLGLLAADGASALQIADAAVAIWSSVHIALFPLIGQRGSAALYKRSLHLAQSKCPWLAAAYSGATKPGDFASLHLVLSQQSAVAAAGAHDAMVQTHHDLLSDLIGRSLTDRLLQTVWESPSNGSAVQDASQ